MTGMDKRQDVFVYNFIKMNVILYKLRDIPSDTRRIEGYTVHCHGGDGLEKAFHDDEKLKSNNP